MNYGILQKFEPNHSHTISPTKSRLFKANKNMNMHAIQINDEAGVRINKTFQTIVRDAGGGVVLPNHRRRRTDFLNVVVTVVVSGGLD
ncbi:hypothetical protein MTR_7g115320 [Medicago truncatula]|uniref:Uncharacterized protein n=1 Tax=Medicago truncatula TaxID=3880 RepID=A0A072UFJ7_MEDTR|nr:hypothetical protein MTR_7g115320 [Medicago truncatula]